MSTLPSLTVKLDADHSCNWKCCFGCKDKKTPTAKIHQESQTEEKVGTVALEAIHILAKPKLIRESTSVFLGHTES